MGTWALDSDENREVLRSHVEPPFDIGQYPSPLASFRRYVRFPKNPPAENLYDRPLFTVTGVPAGTRVRLATLDRYDGIVWGAANDTIPGAVNDTYQRVSSTIDNPVAGTPVSATVTVDEYAGVWLPVVGALQTLRFEAGDVAAKADSFRYNLATSTAVVPLGPAPRGPLRLHRGRARRHRLRRVRTLVPVGEAGGFLDGQVQEWTAGESAPMARVFAAAQHV